MDSMTVLTFISQPFKIEKVQINKVDVGSHKFRLLSHTIEIMIRMFFSYNM